MNASETQATLFPIIVNDGKNFHNKLGSGIARSMSMTGDEDTCPSECTLMWNGCYAQSGPSNFHALRSRRVNTDLYGFMVGLRKNMKMRHNVSGDFFLKDEVDVNYLNEIKRAVTDRPDLQTYGYTHGAKRLAEHNPNELKGLTVNASCETFAEVTEMHALGYPCALVIPAEDATVDGNILPMIKREDMHIRICPNLINDDIKCSDCMLCFKKGAARTAKNSAGEVIPKVVGFLLHGNGKKKAAKAIAAKKLAA